MQWILCFILSLSSASPRESATKRRKKKTSKTRKLFFLYGRRILDVRGTPLTVRDLLLAQSEIQSPTDTSRLWSFRRRVFPGKTRFTRPRCLVPAHDGHAIRRRRDPVKELGERTSRTCPFPGTPNTLDL